MLSHRGIGKGKNDETHHRPRGFRVNPAAGNPSSCDWENSPPEAN